MPLDSLGQDPASNDPRSTLKNPVAPPWAEAAAKAIEKWGWVQFTFINRNTGALCTLGAARIALGLPPIPGVEGSSWVIAQALGFKSASELCKWNNAPNRTIEEVTARLRGARVEGEPQT